MCIWIGPINIANDRLTILYHSMNHVITQKRLYSLLYMVIETMISARNQLTKKKHSSPIRDGLPPEMRRRRRHTNMPVPILLDSGVCKDIHSLYRDHDVQCNLAGGG